MIVGGNQKHCVGNSPSMRSAFAKSNIADPTIRIPIHAKSNPTQRNRISISLKLENRRNPADDSQVMEYRTDPNYSMRSTHDRERIFVPKNLLVHGYRGWFTSGADSCAAESFEVSLYLWCQGTLRCFLEVRLHLEHGVPIVFLL